MCDSPSDFTSRKVNNLIIFENIGDTYPIDEDLVVSFTLCPEVKGSCRDWLGIYEQGWRMMETPLAFEWGLGQRRENCGRKRQITFRSKYLEKADFNTNYQFVYIDKYLDILGESSFFQFRAAKKKDDNNEIIIVNESSGESSQPSSGETYSSTQRNWLSVSEKPMPVRCQFNLRSTGKVYTTCPDCIEFFTSSQIQEELKTKLREYSGSNEGLHKRLSRLEYMLEVPYVPATEKWDRLIEEHQFETFVSEVFGNNLNANEEYAKNGIAAEHLRDESKKIENMNFNIGAVSKKELLLKAIIGHQDIRIRHLNSLLLQNRDIIKPAITVPKSDIIKSFRTDEKMVAEICDLNNNSSDDTSYEDDFDLIGMIDRISLAVLDNEGIL